MELASRQHVGPADRRWHSGRSAARRSAARGQRTPRIAAGAFWPKAVAQQVIEQRAVGARSLPATRGIMMTAILSSAAAGRRILQRFLNRDLFLRYFLLGNFLLRNFLLRNFFLGNFGGGCRGRFSPARR